MTRVPAVLREVDDEAALEITLVENIQREDLNPVEEARAFERFMNEFQLTQEEVATRTGKDRTTVANAVRLLRLEKPILDLIEDGRISPGHGRLAGIADPKLRVALAQARFPGRLDRPPTRAAGIAHATGRLSRRRRRRSTRIRVPRSSSFSRRWVRESRCVAPTKTRPGELVIEYYDAAQLAGLYDRLTNEYYYIRSMYW